MAERRRRRPVVTAPPAPPRVEIIHLDIGEIIPYEFNARDNQAAIESVANSISTFGFLVPVVVDRENVLVAGHTRVEAAKSLGLLEIPAVRADHLTEEQVTAFRLIDNKTAELASWDFQLLAEEIDKLQDSGITLTDFGWDQASLDCLGQLVADDCLATEGLIGLSAEERRQRTERRAPTQTRMVLGELVFFLPATDYRTWVDGIRTLCDYNDADITAELKRRLGILEAA